MLLISSHVLDCAEVRMPEHAVIRVNLAWVDSLEDLTTKLVIYDNCSVLLDNPTDRVKPPNNKYETKDLVDIINEHECIKYFAVSNVEDGKILNDVYDMLPRDVIVIPKIETIDGVDNIESIIDDLKHRSKFIMLDHDDLCADLIRNNLDVGILYSDFIDPMIEKCEKLECKVLRTQGVIFSTFSRSE